MKVLHPSRINDHAKLVHRYIVTADGRVLSRRDGNPMVQRPHPNGYLYVDLSDGNRGVWRAFVHVLVALQHVQRPRAGEGLEVHHDNGRKHDNRSANLVWADVGSEATHGRKCPACGRPWAKPIPTPAGPVTAPPEFDAPTSAQQIEASRAPGSGEAHGT